MFPIGDTDVRGEQTSYVNSGLVVLNIAVFLYLLTLSQNEIVDFFNRFGAIPAAILSGENIYTLFTSMFLHGGWLHIIGNMLFLWIFGDNIEASLGHFWYFVYYVIGGLFATLVYIFINPTSTTPSLGASGAIAAVLGAYIVMFPRSRVRVFFFLGFFFWISRVSALVFIGIWFLWQLLSGVASLGDASAQTGGIAFFAHIGGFVFGVIAGFFLRDQAKKLEFER